MKFFKIGSRKQLMIICGITALTCFVLFIGDIRKISREIVLPKLLRDGGRVISTLRPTSKLIPYQQTTRDKGIQTQSFPACYKETLRETYNRTYAMEKCLEVLRQKCLQSPIKVIKTIRMSLKLVSQLFSEFPDLKIIHLVRDPRATLYSQARFGMCAKKHGGQAGCANTFCTRLENDVLEEEVLFKKYPTRIKTVFYEDIAQYPIETSRDIYKFVGTTFSKRVEEYVHNITMAGNPNNCAICTTRSNSSHHISAWKNKMSRNFIGTIQERCNYILKRYKYEIV